MIRNKSIFVSEEGKVSPFRYASCTLRHWCTLDRCMSVCETCPHYTLQTEHTSSVNQEKS